MRHFMVLATALALLPAFALANTPQPTARANPPPSAVRTPPVCTPVNPCAVPPPAISTLESWRRVTARERAAAQTR